MSSKKHASELTDKKMSTQIHGPRLSSWSDFPPESYSLLWKWTPPLNGSRGVMNRGLILPIVFVWVNDEYPYGYLRNGKWPIQYSVWWFLVFVMNFRQITRGQSLNLMCYSHPNRRTILGCSPTMGGFETELWLDVAAITIPILVRFPMEWGRWPDDPEPSIYQVLTMAHITLCRSHAHAVTRTGMWHRKHSRPVSANIIPLWNTEYRCKPKI